MLKKQQSHYLLLLFSKLPPLLNMVIMQRALWIH
jgi:hypothetical protein